MNNFRKTLAYKICGYSFFVLILAAIIITISVTWNSAMLQGIVLIALLLRIFTILPNIIVLLLIILSLVAYVTQNNFYNAKNSVIADIGYICMLIISALYLLALPFIIHNNIEGNKRQNAYQEYLKNEYPTVIKNSCKLLSNNLPRITGQIGADYTKEELARELAKIENITDVSYDNGNRAISYYHNDSTNTYFKGKTPNRIYLSNHIEPCDIEKRNCYIYLEMHSNYGSCKFYFDKYGKIIPSKETIELVK